MDRDVFETPLGAWAEGRLAGRPESPETAEGIAVDGKTLRGSQKQGAPVGRGADSALIEQFVQDAAGDAQLPSRVGFGELGHARPLLSGQACWPSS